MTEDSGAPGRPGIEPRWTSSAKSGVGTAANLASEVWFTISHGIVNEVYYPTFDQANTRDFGLIVTDGASFFSEEKRDADSQLETVDSGVPGFRLRNLCKQGRYQIDKIVLTDPLHDVLMQRLTFKPLKGNLSDYHLYALLAPHIGNHGSGNSGWVGQYNGIPMLFAQRGSITMALASSLPFLKMSCGYVGASDGWQELSRTKRLSRTYDRADEGNIALTAELDLSLSGELVLALGFGHSAAEAGLRARASLLRDFNQIVDQYTQDWQRVQAEFLNLDHVAGTDSGLYRVSTAVLTTHRSKLFAGAMIASLSIPWGASRGDDDLGGYHLVWPRDLVESAGALLAAGNPSAARETLVFLMATQAADGHWPQNMWMDGTPFWSGVQMDETAFPILLADLLRRHDELRELKPWSSLRQAAAFIVANGPVTQQDRWEEDGGYSPFTLAVEIAALLAAAEFAETAGEADVADYLRQTADTWNDAIESWTYVRLTQMCRDLDVDGYYVRISPPDVAETGRPDQGFVPIKNRPPGESNAACVQIVSPDALALVRFGLRAPYDPRILNTLRVIDAALKIDTSTGPVWHRYDLDGYGEHADGSAFDGTGIGRGWPLLAGERAHYELAAGREGEALRLLEVIEAQTSPGGLMPEQVWDAADIPERELFNGKPAGSAMPLVWAHAEYVKLLRSLRDGVVFDLPPQTVQRYQKDKVRSGLSAWRLNQRQRGLVAGHDLRIELPRPASVHWSTDGWATTQDDRTRDSHIGVHYVDLPTADLAAGARVDFTFRWTQTDAWEGADYALVVLQAAPEGA